MRSKRLISLLVAVCMMITMLPLSAVTAFAADTSWSPDPEAIVDGYKYYYKVNADNTATITYFDEPDTTRSYYNIDIPETLGKYTVTAIGDNAFDGNSFLESVTINDAATSIGNYAFAWCEHLTTVKLGENITTIGDNAFQACYELDNVTIPEKVKKIESETFDYCWKLESITLPAGLTSFEANLVECPDDCVIYFNNDEDTADERFGSHTQLAGRKLLCLCNVTFDANGGKLNGNLTNYLTDNLTDHAEVPVYKTEKITDTKANELTENDLNAINHPTRTGYKFIGWYTKDGKDSKLFNVKDTAITQDITLYAGWKFDPDALDCHQLTVTGGTVTVKYDGSDVTSKLNSRTDAATGKKTYSVPDGATVTVTLDKTAVSNGKVFDGWSTSLPTGQDCKAESITFPMSNGVNVSAKYRDAATDHTHDTAVCHPLTVTGGTVTVKKGDKDVTDTLTVTTDETTGQKTYYVPDNATVTVTLDKTLIPEGMVFDIWSTGKLSLPLVRTTRLRASPSP